MKMFALSLLGLFVSVSAMAAKTEADCKITTTRSLCKGVSEADAYKPYAGKNPTVDDEPKAKDEKACIAAAEKGYKITRVKLLKKKEVVVHFKGKEIAKNVDENKDTKECP